jgi:hypothetical protein
MSFSPNLFLANIRGKDGLAKPARFEVIMPIPPYINEFVESSVIEKILNFPNSVFTDVSDAIGSVFGRRGQEDGYAKTSNSSLTRYLALQCETTELPGKTLQTAEMKVYGPIFKVPYQVQYNDASFTFLCTNDFFERKLFDRWMEAIMPTDTNNLRFPKDDANRTRYMTNIKVVQYDEFIKQIYAVELIDAFPIGVAAQPLNWAEEGFHRLTIQFAYQRYKTIYNGNYNLAAAVTSIFGSVAARKLPLGRAF